MDPMKMGCKCMELAQ